MIEDLPSLKAATIGRCGSHVREESAHAPNTFATDLPARDADILNSLRAKPPKSLDDRADYATCIDGQWYRLGKKQKSRDYRSDYGFKSNLMIYMSFLEASETVPPGLSRTPSMQYHRIPFNQC